MPIWFELVFLSLMAYAIGLGLGWLFWGREIEPIAYSQEDDTQS